MRSHLATLATLLLALPAAADQLESTVLAGQTGVVASGTIIALTLPALIGPHRVDDSGADAEAFVQADVDALASLCAMRLPIPLGREAECVWTWTYTPAADVFYVLTGDLFIVDNVAHVVRLDASIEEQGGPSLYAYASVSTMTVQATLTLGRQDGDTFNAETGSRIGRLDAGTTYIIEATAGIESGATPSGAESIGDFDLELIPVPEPAALAMLVPGVALLGALGRRRARG